MVRVFLTGAFGMMLALPGDAAAEGADGRAKVIAELPRETPAPPRADGVFRGEIDRFIAAKLGRFHVAPARLCDDLDFVRRVYLDLAGVIPTAEEIRDFLDLGYRRREKLIDFLLQSNRYADHWSVLWGDLLRARTRIRGSDPFAMRDYIRAALSANKPYDEWVREMLIAEGTSRDNPATLFVLRNGADPVELAIATTQVFLGVQLKCAQCHDHPYEAWRQSDFDGMKGFFSGTRRRRAFVDEVRRGDRVVELPIDEVVDARPGEGRFLTGTASPQGAGRDGLADLVVRRDNPYFARAAVNRLWAALLGRGLVDPPDAFSPLNPPSHPDLLDWLAVEFVESGYNLKHALRLICNSRTYQLSTVAGRRPADVPDNERFFERAELRRMTAEQLHDSILVSCGLIRSGHPLHRPAIEKRYPAPPSSFLATFASHDRDTIHARDAEATIPQSLALLNGDFVNQAVRMHKTHPVRRWLESGDSREEAVQSLYLQTVGRQPTAKETQWALEVATSPAGWSGLHWALLNTREFMFIR